MEMINPQEEMKISESDLLVMKDFKFIDPLHEYRIGALHIELYKAYSVIRVLKAKLYNRNLLLNNISDENSITVGFNRTIDDAFIEYVEEEYPKLTVKIGNESYTFTCVLLQGKPSRKRNESI